MGKLRDGRPPSVSKEKLQSIIRAMQESGVYHGFGLHTEALNAAVVVGTALIVALALHFSHQAH